MRNRETNIKLVLVTVGSLGAIGLAVGCSPGGSTDTGSTEAAIKAASSTCTSARDACKTQVQSVAAGIEAACKPVETACGDAHRSTADGGVAGSGGSTVDCTAARDACKAAIVAAKPKLEAVGMSCEASIHAACVVDFGDGGRLGDPADDDHDGGRGGVDDHRGDHDGGAGGRGGQVESAACEAAETACLQSLESLKSMPPMACTAVETACGGQTPSTATDACKMAISDCQGAITTVAASAHQVCGTDIAAACGGHGG